MDITSLDGAVRVSLSRRNLKDLLAQLDTYGYAELHRSTQKGVLVVYGQTDEVHYTERVPGRGSGLVE